MPKKGSNVYIKRSSSGKVRFIRVKEPDEDYCCHPPSPPPSPPYHPHQRAGRPPLAGPSSSGMATLAIQNDQLRQQLAAIKFQYDRAVQDIHHLREVNADLLNQRQRLTGDLNHQREVVGEMKEDLEVIKRKYDQAKDNNSMLKQEIKSIRQQGEVLRDERARRLEDELRVRKEQVDDWKLRYRMVVKECEDRKDAMDRNEVVKQRMRDSHAVLENQNALQKVEIREMRRDLSYYRRMFEGGP